MQHTVFSHCDVGGVGKVNKPSHHLRADVAQGHLRGVALFEAAGEHGSEVWATRRQHQPVHLRNHKPSVDHTEALSPTDLEKHLE